MSLAQFFGYSQQLYKYPIRPRQGEKIRFWENDLSHVDRDLHAKDIITPDPRRKVLPVWAPQSGVVIELVQSHTQWGGARVFARLKNFVRVRVSDREFYLIAHIGVNSCPFSVGSWVEVGQQLAVTGANGWMTDPRHLHFVVGLFTYNNYRSLRIRWDRNQEYASAK